MRPGSFTATPQLRLARLRKGLTQEELADRAGIDRSHLSYIERGIRAIRPNTARALARALRMGFTEALHQHLFELDFDALDDPIPGRTPK